MDKPRIDLTTTGDGLPELLIPAELADVRVLARIPHLCRTDCHEFEDGSIAIVFHQADSAPQWVAMTEKRVRELAREEITASHRQIARRLSVEVGGPITAKWRTDG